jgi:molybdopterin-guanine dinucleotide biosynthesis protein A
VDDPRTDPETGAQSPRNVSVAVLAGGRSRRMGTDKRRALFDGVPLLRRAVALADTLSDDVMVVVAEDQPIPQDLLDGLRWRAMHDTRRDHGPLAGRHSRFPSASSAER